MNFSSFKGDAKGSDADLRRLFLPPYIEAVKRNVLSIMPSYSSWNGIKMHAQKHLLTDLLKKELGFKGFLVSDWGAINQLPQSTDALRLYESINAGVDMVMMGDRERLQDVIGDLIAGVKTGHVSDARINDAVKRILRAKVKVGLFEHAFSNRTLLPQVGNHRQLAREAVRQSVVLLKNGMRTDRTGTNGTNGTVGSERVLPLRKDGMKILVAGKSADDIGRQCGGWTLTWQGASGNTVPGTTILQAVKSAVSDRGSVVYDKDVNGTVPPADVGIVVVGENPYAEYYGDDPKLELNGTDPAVVRKVCGAMPCVVLLVTGRPLSIEPLLPDIDALVVAWLPGSEGTGVTDLLFGDVEFTGRLPRNWFRRVEQLPMNVGDKDYDPLFSFGFGLNSKGQTLE